MNREPFEAQPAFMTLTDDQGREFRRRFVHIQRYPFWGRLWPNKIVLVLESRKEAEDALAFGWVKCLKQRLCRRK